MDSNFSLNFFKLISCVFLLSLVPRPTDAQIWTRIYWYTSNAKSDRGMSIAEADNGSLIVAGGYLGHLVKLDKTGHILWQKSFEEITQANDLVLTPNGDICLVGHGDDNRLWLIKTNAQGNKQWARQLGDYSDVANLLRNKDGGFTIMSKGLIITDSEGQVLSQTAADGYRFIQLPSSEYLIADGFQLKLLDANGNSIWTKPLDGARSVAAASDGNFVTMGYSETDQFIYLTKWDLNGNEIWYKSYPQLDVRPFQLLWNKMVITPNDEIAFIAFVDGVSAFIAKTDAEGNLLCSRTQALDNLNVILENLIATSDNGFALVGMRENVSSSGFLDEDLFVMKTDAICQTADLEIIYIEEGEVDTVYSSTFNFKYGPNPCQRNVNFEIQPTKAFDGKMMLVVYDAFGRIKKAEKILAGTIEITTDELSGGMYFFKIYENGKVLGKGKIAVQR
jgi:PQQ-like domain